MTLFKDDPLEDEDVLDEANNVPPPPLQPPPLLPTPPPPTPPTPPDCKEAREEPRELEGEPPDDKESVLADKLR